MTRTVVVMALWGGFALVTWNVMFDRYVMGSAIEFTRVQVVRYQNGEPLLSIHEGFSPRLRDAALQASLWVAPIVAAGALATALTRRQGR